MGTNESDSNADTCCLGTNFIVLSYTQRTADVYAYDATYAPMSNVPIVTGATAWTDPMDNKTYILVFNESLYYGTKLKHSLINPNQIRHNGIDFWDNPFDGTRKLGIDIDRGPIIPLRYIGTKLIFTSRAPTSRELSECEHIEMTSTRQWNPESVSLVGSLSSKPSDDCPQLRVRVSSTDMSTNPYSHASRDRYQYLAHDSEATLLHDISPSLVELKEIATKVMSPESEVPSRKSLVSRERHPTITPENLAELWCIGPNKARATLHATTQMATRSAVLPISRRYRADKMYGVKRLNGKFSTDTLWSNCKSLHQNSHGQVFSHKMAFQCAIP